MTRKVIFVRIALATTLPIDDTAIDMIHQYFDDSEASTRILQTVVLLLLLYAIFGFVMLDTKVLLSGNS